MSQKTVQTLANRPDDIVEYIHQEIASNGTGSIFADRGLDMKTGEYDVEEIANAIEDGDFPEITE